MFNIVLFEPEIPQNTGNIVRTCSATGSSLHLIKPLGFEIDEKSVKRAGLDYWDDVKIVLYENINEFFQINCNGKIYFSTTKVSKNYSQIDFDYGDFIVFGKETKGIPESILIENLDRCFRIPMIEGKRSLNLSNSVAIVLYEAFKKNEFKGLSQKGKLD